MVQSVWKTVCQFLIKLNMQLSYVPTTVLQGTYSREMQTNVCTKKLQISMFISALFIIVTDWKQPALVYSGCYNKIPQTRQLINNRNLLLIVLKGASQCQQSHQRALFWWQTFLCGIVTCGRGQEALWGLFHKALIHS